MSIGYCRWMASRYRGVSVNPAAADKLRKRPVPHQEMTEQVDARRFSDALHLPSVMLEVLRLVGNQIIEVVRIS
jgi:hypothetical protein